MNQNTQSNDGMTIPYNDFVGALECNYDDALRERAANCSRLLHALIGLSTEVNEMLDNVKAHIFYGKDIDWDNMNEEWGDVAFFQQMGMDETGTTLEKAQEGNRRKLMHRYGGAEFNADRAINRPDKADEIAAMKGELND